MNENLFNIIQLVLAVLLIAVILLQQRGSGLSSTFGGLGNVYATRRGIEKILFISTIVLVIVFMTIALARVLLL